MAIEEEVNKLRAMMHNTPNGDLNSVEFDGEQVTASDVIAAASAYPFLADKRLVIVKGMLAHITRKGAGETGKKAVEQLLDALPHLPEYARLVFAEREALSESSKLMKLTAEKGFAKLYAAPKDSTAWILKRAKEYYKAPISHRAAAALASVTPEDLRRADNELVKLISYVDGREITEDDVALLTPYVQEASLFEMVDALAEGRAAAATALLHRLLDDREDPFAVYGMIVRQFRLLLLAKEHLTTGGKPATIADALRVHRFVGEKLAKQTRAFNVSELEKIYRTLADYDLKMKTGRIEPELALDMLIASLAR
jgi:DNA polymerase-3 subunit delta